MYLHIKSFRFVKGWGCFVCFFVSKYIYFCWQKVFLKNNVIKAMFSRSSIQYQAS